MRLLPLFLLLLIGQLPSWSTTLDFSEFGTSPAIDANGIHINGVLIGFSTSESIYNQIVGTAGNAILSIDPVLSGPTTGILTFTFDIPTPFLKFDILLQSIFPIDDSDQGFNGGPAYTVQLSNGSSISGGTEPQPGGSYSEGEFVYAGDPINSASITFFNGFDESGMPVSAFGLDNLAFATPEPASFLGLGGGLLALGLLKRRRTAYKK
jgi:PEP-CTERM motif